MNIKMGNTLTTLEFRSIEADTLVNVTGKHGALNVQIEY